MIVMTPLVNEAAFDSTIYCELGFTGYRLLETIGVSGLAWALRGAKATSGKGTPAGTPNTPGSPASPGTPGRPSDFSDENSAESPNPEVE